MLHFRSDGNFLKARQEAKKGELDEQLKEYINEWRKQRAKEEEELARLKEKQAKRKEIRAEQEKKLAQQKKEEEERMRREEAEKKAKEAEEKRKRLEEAEKKRQAMMAAQKEKQQQICKLNTTEKPSNQEELSNWTLVRPQIVPLESLECPKTSLMHPKCVPNAPQMHPQSAHKVSPKHSQCIPNASQVRT